MRGATTSAIGHSGTCARKATAHRDRSRPSAGSDHVRHATLSVDHRVSPPQAEENPDWLVDAEFGWVIHRNCEAVLALPVMRNITIAVPDDVYRSARIRAAERGTSVSGLVAEYLRSLSDRDAEFARLEARQRQIQAEIRDFRAGDRLGRNELHSRAVR